jgi:hypothetical protein
MALRRDSGAGSGAGLSNIGRAAGYMAACRGVTRRSVTPMWGNPAQPERRTRLAGGYSTARNSAALRARTSGGTIGRFGVK